MMSNAEKMIDLLKSNPSESYTRPEIAKETELDLVNVKGGIRSIVESGIISDAPAKNGMRAYQWPDESSSNIYRLAKGPWVLAEMRGE